MTTRFEYREYKIGLDIGISNAQRIGAIHPKDSYSQQEWDALTDEEKENWLNEASNEWANNYIDVWHE
ncbi:MAG TPA: hypothetical protein V6C57_23680 [Coleofasciculaceae cyanobacterium]